MKLFSKQELSVIRNKISIDILIEKFLLIPCKFSEDYFRFLCPVCNEFHTAINHKTNLARCFTCRKNFNTIDIVIIVKKMDFVESVNFLKTCLEALQPKDDSRLSKPCLPNSNAFEDMKRRESPPRDRNKLPVPLGEILKKTLPHLATGISQNEVTSIKALSERPVNRTENDSILYRIEKLEQKMSYLSNQLEKLISFIGSHRSIV